MEELDFLNLNICIDEEFWNDFVQEAFEHIEEIEMNILTLEKELDNMEIIHSMFRAFHSIKGLSGFVEHTLIQEVSHITETLMDFCRKGTTKVTPDIVNGILKSSDYIKNLCNDLNAWQNTEFVSDISAHLKFLNNLVEQIEQSDNKNEVFLTDEKDANAFMMEDFSVLEKEELPTSPLPEEPELESVNEKPALKVETKIKSANEEYMKVANSKIDYLVDMIGELIINQSLIKEYVATNYSQDGSFIKNLDGLSLITRELQDISMFLRLVSLKSTFQKLTRIARDTINELGKDIEFVTTGDSTEIDRAVADKLLEPLVHLIKNAISHGIEANSDDRINKGKSHKGVVELSAYNRRGKIYIEIKDDGRGIDTDIVYKKALEKGLIDPNKDYTPEEIKEFIMLPGFSTAEKVDNISGRGVGMDVVKTQIYKIGGKVTIKSELDKGSTFVLEVPVNHAIMNGIVIDILNQQFIIPTVNISEIIQPTEDMWVYTNKKRTMINIRDNIIPVIMISKLLSDVPDNTTFPLVMLLEIDGDYRALPITNVINRQEVVVKPAGDEFSGLRYLSGMSILGNGQVSLILDISYMFDF